ncbi:MAG: hypothetical protein IJB49_06840 [Clostridia bacterium]|nr:hypothetical protein [Clostridia bacterium]
MNTFLPLVIAKKFGLMIVYYFLLSLIDSLAAMLSPNPFFSFSVTAVALCVIAYAFRKALIHKLNYTQEQRDEYNACFKNKALKIIKSPQFIAEMIMIAFITLVFMLIPRIAIGLSAMFQVLYINRAAMLIFTLLYVVIDFVIWLLAYRSSFKPKKVVY